MNSFNAWKNIDTSVFPLATTWAFLWLVQQYSSLKSCHVNEVSNADEYVMKVSFSWWFMSSMCDVLTISNTWLRLMDTNFSQKPSSTHFKWHKNQFLSFLICLKCGLWNDLPTDRWKPIKIRPNNTFICQILGIRAKAFTSTVFFPKQVNKKRNKK